MNYYIAQDDVDSSIKYFKNAGFDSDDMLFLFLMSKHLGVSVSYPVTYLVGKLTDINKSEYLNTIWMLGAYLIQQKYAEREDCCSQQDLADWLAISQEPNLRQCLAELRILLKRKILMCLFIMTVVQCLH